MQNSVPLMMEVEEEMPINMKIGEVIAIDKDIGKNAIIDYAIICKLLISYHDISGLNKNLQMAMMMGCSGLVEMIRTEESSRLRKGLTEKSQACIHLQSNVLSHLTEF